MTTTLTEPTLRPGIVHYPRRFEKLDLYDLRDDQDVRDELTTDAETWGVTRPSAAAEQYRAVAMLAPTARPVTPAAKGGRGVGLGHLILTLIGVTALAVAVII